MASDGGQRTGRPPKPTALKVLHGDFKKNPQTRNRNEPSTRGEVVTPDTLSPQAKVMWDYLAPLLIKAGILTPPDTPMLAEFCEATVVVRLARIQVMRYATGQAEIAPGAASPFTSYLRAVNVMTNLGGRLGLSPADRSRLVVDNTDHQASRDDLISG